MTPGPHFDVAVIGAGAAGLMCALTAGRRGRSVLLLDHAQEAGAKILISGGGRCNFTNTGTLAERFLSENPHFARSALDRYTPADFVALVRAHGIAYHEKTLGQLFCDGSARAIVAMLLAECAAAGVTLRLGHRVTELSRAEHYAVATDRGAFSAGSLVLATGGLSIPKLGATGFAHDAARRFGLRLTALAPALVPLTFGGELLELMRPLSGVALSGEASLGRQRFREALLFTHRGLSGPAILQISSFWREGAVTLDLLPGQDAAALLLARKRERPRAELRSVLAELLPARLAQALAASLAGPGTASAVPAPGDPRAALAASAAAAGSTAPMAVRRAGVAAASAGACVADAAAGAATAARRGAAVVAAPAVATGRGPSGSAGGGPAPTRMADLPDRSLRALAARLQAWQVAPSGTEGYAKAEVTRGGVDTRDLSSRTMAARGVPGLFVVGEAVDVTGWLGGYNFQWAWASGWCAGMAA